MTVEYVTAAADTTGRLAAGELTAALRRIGYRPRVDIVGMEAALGRRIGNTQGWNIGSGEWTADYPAAGQFLDHFLRCSNYHPDDPAVSTNSGGFCNPRLDRLVARAQALQMADPAAAETIWARADRLAVDEAAWVPLANLGSADLVSRRVGHFTLDATGQPQLDTRNASWSETGPSGICDAPTSCPCSSSFHADVSADRVIRTSQTVVKSRLRHAAHRRGSTIDRCAPWSPKRLQTSEIPASRSAGRGSCRGRGALRGRRSGGRPTSRRSASGPDMLEARRSTTSTA